MILIIRGFVTQVGDGSGGSLLPHLMRGYGSGSQGQTPVSHTPVSNVYSSRVTYFVTVAIN
jgi:hypothetical protein